MDQVPTEYESEIIDVTDLTLREVMALDESVFGHALRRLWQEADLPEEVAARFDQAI